MSARRSPASTAAAFAAASASASASALGLGSLELGRDQRVVLRPQVDLIVEVQLARDAFRLVAVPGKAVLTLEGLDLLDTDFELVGDPSVCASLAGPSANLIELWTERSAGHGRSETSGKAPRRTPAGSLGSGRREAVA